MMQSVSFHKAIIFFIALLVLAGGIFIRVRFSYWHLLENNNVGSYYLAKTIQTERDGRFPRADTLDRAGDSYRENAPPFLAYATLLPYYAISVFIPALTITDFAKLFPIIVFIAWAVMGFFAIKRLCPSIGARIAFLLLISALPASIELTRVSNYFEEVLGVALFFFALLFLIQLDFSRRRMLGGVILLSALILTWQQFPVFYAGAAMAILLEAVVFRKQSWGFIKRTFPFLLLPLILDEIITRFFLDIAYTPLEIFRELVVSISVQQDPALSWVMRRLDWGNFSIWSFFKAFGILGIFLGIIGFIAALWQAHRERSARIIVIFGALAILAPIFFIKERFLTLGILLVMASYGAEMLFSGEITKFLMVCQQRSGQLFRMARILLHDNKIFYRAVILTVALASLAFFTNKMALREAPRPILQLLGAPKAWEVGEKYRLTLRLENIGGASLKQANAFGGVHIEVENASVGFVREKSDADQSSTVFKRYASWGNIFFFETKFSRLQNGQTGEVFFDVTPYWLPVHIYYRGWLPASCTHEDAKKVLLDLRPEFKDSSNLWRSEDCIRRAPENKDEVQPLCKVPVLAAHENPPLFRCFVDE